MALGKLFSLPFLLLLLPSLLSAMGHAQQSYPHLPTTLRAGTEKRTAAGGGGGSGGSQNKLSHVFEPKHKLDVLVKTYGSEEKAWAAIQQAAKSQLTGQGVADGEQAIINVGGKNVTVTGYNSAGGYVAGNAWIR